MASAGGTPSVIACGDATLPLLSLRDIFPRPGEVGPQGDGFRGSGKVSGTAQRRPLGGAGCERSEQTEGVLAQAEGISNRSPRQPAELLHGKAGLQGAVDAARQQSRAVGDDAVQRPGRDHKVCALLRLHQGGDARRHHRHA